MRLILSVIYVPRYLFGHLFTILLLPTERKVQSRELYTEMTEHTVVHTHTNLLVSSFCVGHARREFEIPSPWPKLGTNGPNFGHPDISVTNSPILTFDGSNESQCKAKSTL